MNAKRQTIWLVSMLSLMVVLSAYYLFTENSAKVDLTTASGNVNSTAGNPVALDMKDPNGAKVASSDAAKVEVKPDPNQTTAQAGAKIGSAATDAKAAAPDAKATDAKTAAPNAKAADVKTSATDAKAGNKATNGQAATSKQTAQMTDAQVLDKMTSAALTGSDYFIDQQMKREAEISKQTEALMATTADSKKSTQELEKAYNELEKLQTMTTNVSHLEEQLKQSYQNVFVTKDGEKYKVAVQAQKLAPSEAVTIVDLTMKEMSVSQDKVVVQYMP